MDIEKRIIKFQIGKTKEVQAEVILIEPEDGESVRIEVELLNKKYSYQGDDFFSTLIKLREELEKENIQILCNGAGKNIYPSAMTQSMGTGSKAYKLFLGEKGLLKNLVNIFDIDNDVEFVSIKEQKEFYNNWLNSIG